MNEQVSDVITARARQADGPQSMVWWSVGAHAILIAVLLIASSRQAVEPPRTVMTISLGGAPGPRQGGLTQVGGRATPPPAQAAPEKPAVQEVKPAASAPPAMTLPSKETRPQPRAVTAKPAAQAIPTPSASPAPSTAPAQTGNAPAETGARGQGFGLSGAGGNGRSVQLDVGDFCCPEYLEQMMSQVQRNWQQDQGVVGSTMMKFTIQRDGSIEAVSVERSSGFYVLDNAASRALQLAKVSPLPAPFPNPTLTVHMRFDYKR